MLDQLVDDATDSRKDLPSILRRLLVIATKLDNAKLKEWIKSELYGYRGVNREDFPSHRVLPIQAVGYFIGIAHQLNDMPLAAGVLRDEHRDWATRSFLMQPIAAYDEFLKEAKGDRLEAPWPADIVYQYQDKFFDDSDLILNRAKQLIPKSGIVGLVDTVRNKVLELALELQKELGESEPSPTNPPPERVDQAVNTFIFQGATTVYGAIGGSAYQSITQSIVQGDFHSLAKALDELIELPEEETRQLEEAIEADKAAEEGKGMGSKTRQWIARVARAGGRGALKVSEKVVEQLMIEAIKKYYGL